MVRPAGLEPATLCLEGRCSIHLSYGRTKTFGFCGVRCSENRGGIVRKQFNGFLFVFPAETRVLLNHIQTLEPFANILPSSPIYSQTGAAKYAVSRPLI